MKLQLSILTIFSTLAFVTANTVKIDIPLDKKTIVSKLICDTVSYKLGVKQCMKDSGVTLYSPTYFKAYCKKDCMELQKTIHCKLVKGISIFQDGEEVNWTPCDQITSRKDRKLCE